MSGEAPGRPLLAAAEVADVVCRLRAGRVEADIRAADPSAASLAVVCYLGAVAGELARLPHRYGHDPEASYAVAVQTWDRALSPLPSLALGRPVEGFERVGLIPDLYYIDSGGFERLHVWGLNAPKWSRRAATVVWRGSVTGQGAFHSPADIPRVALALACRGAPGTDVAVIGVHETLAHLEPGLSDYLRREGLVGGYLQNQDYAHYRYAIDIDGHANAWGLLEKLILGCCVLKVATPFEQWFYPRLHAWEHFVPVAADLSDLGDAIAWCRANAAQCEWIAANGARLAATLRWRAELPRSCLAVMAAAQAWREV